MIFRFGISDLALAWWRTQFVTFNDVYMCISGTTSITLISKKYCFNNFLSGSRHLIGYFFVFGNVEKILMAPRSK